MTHTRHVTPARTAARLEKIRKLLTTLQKRQLRHDEICDLLQVGPSGVRKYLSDLRGLIERVKAGGEWLYRLAATAKKEVYLYLRKLSAAAPARPTGVPQSPERLASASRHFHILADDTHYAIRVNRAPIVRDPLVEAFFGPAVPAGLLMQSPPCSTRVGAV